MQARAALAPSLLIGAGVGLLFTMAAGTMQLRCAADLSQPHGKAMLAPLAADAAANPLFYLTIFALTTAGLVAVLMALAGHAVPPPVLIGLTIVAVLTPPLLAAFWLLPAGCARPPALTVALVLFAAYAVFALLLTLTLPRRE